MIGITGVTGKLGSYVANLVDKKGMVSVHLARSPERAKVYASAEIRKMVYTNTPEVVEALKGIDTLLMVSARENPERVKEHKDFLDAAKKEFEQCKVTFGVPQMKTLGIMNQEGIYTNLGLLLSDQCVHTIKAAVFEGTTQNEFKDRREFASHVTLIEM